MKRGQTDTRKPGRTGTGRIEKACTHLSGILIPAKLRSIRTEESL